MMEKSPVKILPAGVAGTVRLRRAVALGAILLWLVGLQRWTGFYEGLALISASDVWVYLRIAAAAPGLPVDPLPFHLAQRITGPYLTGLISEVSGVPVVTVLSILTVLSCGIAVAAGWWALAALPLREGERLLALGMLVLSPRLLRVLLVASGLLPDALFVAGESVLLAGLVRGSSGWLLVGAVLATAGRQTALLLLPGAAIWLLAGACWRRKPLPGRLLRVAALGIVIVGGYLVTWAIAETISPPGRNPRNVMTVAGLAVWLASGNSLLSAPFGELVARCIEGLALPVAAAGGVAMARLAQRRTVAIPVEALSATVIGLTIAAQPLLGGPVFTAGAASRLATLGLPALVIGLAILLAQERTAGRPLDWGGLPGISMVFLLFARSFHHLNTIVGPPDSRTFAVLQILVAVGGAAACFLAARVSAPPQRVGTPRSRRNTLLQLAAQLRVPIP